MVTYPRLLSTAIKVWGYGEYLEYDAEVEVMADGEREIKRLELTNEPKEHLSYIADHYDLWGEAINQQIDEEVGQFLTKRA